MKTKLITLCVCMFSLLIVKGQSAAAPSDISKQMGQTITVCGMIKEVHLDNPTSTSSTVITVDGNSPSSPATTIIVTDKIKKQLDYSFESLKGKNICFTGKVKNYKDKPAIMVLNESGISKSK